MTSKRLVAPLKEQCFYSLEDGRALTHREAIGNAMTKGGYVVYIPNDAFTKEWTAEALKWSVGGDPLTGRTMQQIIFQESTAKKDRTCISSWPTMVKTSFMTIVGSHQWSNTPKSLEGKDGHSFLM
jgi:hypothetical protein